MQKRRSSPHPNISLPPHYLPTGTLHRMMDMPAAPSPDASASAMYELAKPIRRSHTKSRSGCRECKQRKVKCDERLPTCFNCARRGMVCSLTSLGGSSDDGLPTRRTSRDAVVRSSPGGRPLLLRGPGTPPLPSPPASFSDHGLELMHHYATVTADTLAHRLDMQHVWRMVVPQMSYAEPFLSHGLLSIAALHKADLQPARREAFLDLAAHHQTCGMQGFRAFLSSLDDDNWPHAFCFSSTIVIYAFSAAGRTDDSMADVLKLFVLLRGLRSSLGAGGTRFLDTPLSPWSRGIWIAGEEDAELPPTYVPCPSSVHEKLERQRSLDPPLEHSVLPPDTFRALRRLYSFYRTSLPGRSRADYEYSTMQLRRAATLLAAAGPRAEMGMVMFIPYHIPAGVMADIQAGNPYALVFLSYFALLLAAVESQFWYARGWSGRLMRDVEARLEGNAKMWKVAKWPKTMAARYYRT